MVYTRDSRNNRDSKNWKFEATERENNIFVKTSRSLSRLHDNQSGNNSTMEIYNPNYFVPKIK